MEAETPSGEILLCHCANSGSMTGLLEPGAKVLLTDKGENAKGKLRYAWQAVQIGKAWVGVNTLFANRVAEALLRQDSSEVRREAPYGQEKSRIDFLVDGRRWVEVKSVTLKVGHQAQFPDAVTTRGQKHLRELAALARAGEQAELLLLVQRSDCNTFAPAASIDPQWSANFYDALAAGMKAKALVAAPDGKGQFHLGPELPIQGV